MNKKILNFIFYLCISFFAFQCATSDSPKITKKEETPKTATEQYVEDLISEEGEAHVGLGLNRENILITDLQSELHTNKAETQKLRALVRGLEKQLNKQGEFNSSELWSSPFSMYNQEVLMQSGTVYYGNIIYQDEALVTLETMIGKLNLDRTKIVRVISHKTDALENVVELPELEGLEQFPEIEDGSIIYKQPAEIKFEWRFDTRYYYKNWIFSIYYETENAEHIGFPDDNIYAGEVTGKRKIQSLFIRTEYIIEF